MEFTIQTLAILIIMAITLIAVIVFFMYGMKQRETLELQQSINGVCQRFTSLGCNDDAWNEVEDSSLTGADISLDADDSGSVEVSEYFSKLTLQIRCICTPWWSGGSTGGTSEECTPDQKWCASLGRCIDESSICPA